MTVNVLITGASGYLGGSILQQLMGTEISNDVTLYALVRTPEQAKAVQQYSAKPVEVDLQDSAAIASLLIANKITIVFYLVDAADTVTPTFFISALAKIKTETGCNVYFLFTSGAKLFSDHVSAPTSDVSDLNADLYDTQKTQAKTCPSAFAKAINANNLVIDAAEQHGVRAYIFIPCIVYGKGLGLFGNVTSIQTKAIVRAAKTLRTVYSVNADNNASWPVCHIVDNTSLYIRLLEGMVKDEEIGYGRSGYYLASSGSIKWSDLYAAIAQALHSRGEVDSEQVKVADADAFSRLAQALGCPQPLVRFQIGGNCALVAERGKKIGWQPIYKPQHILEAASDEVALLLEHGAK